MFKSNNITVNLENLKEDGREALMKLIEKSQRKSKDMCELSEIEIGDTFKIGDITFIKFAEKDGIAEAVSKDILFTSQFGSDNNFEDSTVLSKLTKEVLPKIEKEIGKSAICSINTDLTTLDGLKNYGVLNSKISLPTLDYYREHVEIFDKYKIDRWWWLATADSAKPHCSPNWVLCVSPSCDFSYSIYDLNFGVRPFLRFVSSISVSREE